MPQEHAQYVERYRELMELFARMGNTRDFMQETLAELSSPGEMLN